MGVGGTAREQINAWRASDKLPAATLHDDTACFLAFSLLDEIIVKTLGHQVPILSTEGGPVVGWKDDRRYPRIDPATHAAWVAGINDFMQGRREIHGVRCPDNYFTLCHWLLANYRLGFMAPGWESQCWYSDWWNDEFRLSGELPAVAAVKAMPDSPIDLDGRFAFEGLPAGRYRRSRRIDAAGLALTGENRVQLPPLTWRRAATAWCAAAWPMARAGRKATS